MVRPGSVSGRFAGGHRSGVRHNARTAADPSSCASARVESTGPGTDGECAALAVALQREHISRKWVLQHEGSLAEKPGEEPTGKPRQRGRSMHGQQWR
jgi:hypothetical protein